MFGIGGFELFLILIFGFLVLGPDKLPAMAKTLGKAVNKFRSARDEMDQIIKSEVYDPVEHAADEAKKAVSASADKKQTSAKASRASQEAKGMQAAGKDEEKPSVESYAERKARYEKERAAKKAQALENDAETAHKLTAADLYGVAAGNAATDAARAAAASKRASSADGSPSVASASSESGSENGSGETGKEA